MARTTSRPTAVSHPFPFVSTCSLPFATALYLEKLGEGHFEEALREMDEALARMPR